MKKKILRNGFIFLIVFMMVLFLIPSLVFAEPPSASLTITEGAAGEDTEFLIETENAIDEDLILIIWPADEWEAYVAAGFPQDVFTPVAQVNIDNITTTPWNGTINYALPGGRYVANFFGFFCEGGNPSFQADPEYFKILPYAEILVDEGYAGQNTKITFRVSGSNRWYVEYAISNTGHDYTTTTPFFWEHVIEEILPVGNYTATFSVFREDDLTGTPEFDIEKDFTIIAAPAPKPPTPKPVGPSIDQKPLSNYETTPIGAVTFFYNRLLGRTPEPDGLNAWAEMVQQGSITGHDMLQGFIFSQENQQRISGYTNEQFLKYLYSAIFNREPDPEGYEFWMAKLTEGMSWQELVWGFGGSQEFIGLCNTLGIQPY